MDKQSQEEDQELQELFPFVKRWRSIYRFVLVELAVLIVLFYLLTRAFA